MKLLSFFLFITCMHAFAVGNAQKVSINGKQMRIADVLKQIGTQSGHEVIFTDDIFQNTPLISLNLKDVELSTALDECLKGKPFVYEIMESVIVIKRAPTTLIEGLNHEVTSPSLPPPPITVRGRIVNEKGEPVVASILIKGTTRGTTSNFNGEFEIYNVDDKSVLIISAANIESIAVSVEGKTNITVHVQTATASLSEVVVNKGYYKESKRFSTGSVAKISSAEIEKQPVDNVLAAVTGRMAGVQVSQTTGVAGGGFNIAIRGKNSIANGNEPLYIIDGVPFPSTSASNFSNRSPNLAIIPNSSPLNNISPTDIESIEILKDADATSIYGSRGANGVVLITTKKGNAESARLSTSFYKGVGKVTRKMDLLDTRQYLEMRREAFTNDGKTPTTGFDGYDILLFDSTRNTDWQKELIGGTAKVTSAQASFTGGNQTTQYFISTNYYSQSTVFPGDYADKKYSGRITVSHHSPNNKLNGTFTLGYSVDDNNLIPVDLTKASLHLPPNAPKTFDEEGNLNWGPLNFDNPYSLLLKKYEVLTKNVLANTSISYRVMSNLTLKVNAGLTSMQLDEFRSDPKISNNPLLGIQYGSAVFSNGNINSWIVEPQAEYIRDIGNGRLTVLAGGTFQQSKEELLSVDAGGFRSDILLNNIQAASSFSIRNNTYREYAYQAVFGRINYELQQKYILNLTARRDGSSRFGPGKRFANFHAVGVAWIFSDEDFLDFIQPALTYGKIRASYGSTGNDKIEDYGYLDTYSSPPFGYDGVSALNPVRLANADYSWEKNQKLEMAIELGFLNNRVLFSTGYYRNRSSNQLLGLPLPAITGRTSIQFNLPAVVQNQGVEFELNTINIKREKLSWTTQANFTIPQNKLIAYPNIDRSGHANTLAIDKSLYVIKAYHYLGVNAETGVDQYEDVNRNGNSFNFPDDLQAIKEVRQKFFGGIANSVSAGPWQFDFFVQYVNQTQFNYIVEYDMPGIYGNQPAVVMRRWQNSQQSTDIQKFSQDYSSPTYLAYNNGRTSGDKRISDASFVRLKNISIGYSLPKSLLKKVNIATIQLFIRAQNLVTFTNYLGMDPENASFVNLPPLKMVTAGIHLNL